MKNWNLCAYLIGPPGYGKTSLMSQLVRRHLKAVPTGPVLIHDPVAQFRRDGAVFYKDVDAYRARLVEVAKKKGERLPRVASIGGSAEALTRFALQLGERGGNSQDYVRTPILLGFDEGSLRDGSGATWMGKDDNELLATRRHRGVGIMTNIQDASQLTERFFRMSTDVYVMAQTSKNALRLDRAMMLEDGTLERAGVTTLEPHKYLHVKLRVGVVPEAL